MKWFVGTGLMLLLALALDLGLMAYAMYALLSVMVVSRLLSESWIHNLHAQRQSSRQHHRRDKST